MGLYGTKGLQQAESTRSLEAVEDDQIYYQVGVSPERSIEGKPDVTDQTTALPLIMVGS